MQEAYPNLNSSFHSIFHYPHKVLLYEPLSQEMVATVARPLHKGSSLQPATRNRN